MALNHKVGSSSPPSSDSFFFLLFRGFTKFINFHFSFWAMSDIDKMGFNFMGYGKIKFGD